MSIEIVTWIDYLPEVDMADLAENLELVQKGVKFSYLVDHDAIIFYNGDGTDAEMVTAYLEEIGAPPQ